MVYRPAGKGATAWKVKMVAPPGGIGKGLGQWRACPTMMGSGKGKESNVALPGINVELAGVPGNRSTISSRFTPSMLSPKLVKVME